MRNSFPLVLLLMIAAIAGCANQEISASSITESEKGELIIEFNPNRSGFYSIVVPYSAGDSIDFPRPANSSPSMIFKCEGSVYFYSRGFLFKEISKSFLICKDTPDHPSWGIGSVIYPREDKLEVKLTGQIAKLVKERGCSLYELSLPIGFDMNRVEGELLEAERLSKVTTPEVTTHGPTNTGTFDANSKK